MNIPRILVPARPGITNALGCVVADIRHDFVRTVNRPLDSIEMKEIRDVLAEQIAEGQRLIESETIALDDTRILHGADMQFIGQTHLISIPIPSLETPKEEIQRIFETAYFNRFQVELPEIRANLVNLKTSVIGVRPNFDLARIVDPAARADCSKRRGRPLDRFGSLVRGMIRRFTAARACPSAVPLRAPLSSSKWIQRPLSSPAIP